jgi:RimJ/RimL family protein N-acetyltransferase
MTSELHSSKDVIKNPIEIKSFDGEITLKQFTPLDSEEIFALIDRNRDHLSQFGDETSEKYPTPQTVLDSIEFPKDPKRLRFAIRNKQEQLVGTINLTPDEDDPTIGETGCYLGAEFQKHGYMGKAVQTLTDYAFKTLGYKTIYGDVVVGNTASSNVLLKADYKETKRYDNKIRYSKIK